MFINLNVGDFLSSRIIKSVKMCVDASTKVLALLIQQNKYNIFKCKSWSETLGVEK